MKKPNKETLIEIIGAVLLLAIIGGIISCNAVGCNIACQPICNTGPNYDDNYALSR